MKRPEQFIFELYWKTSNLTCETRTVAEPVLTNIPAAGGPPALLPSLPYLPPPTHTPYGEARSAPAGPRASSLR